MTHYFDPYYITLLYIYVFLIITFCYNQSRIQPSSLQKLWRLPGLAVTIFHHISITTNELIRRLFQLYPLNFNSAALSLIQPLPSLSRFCSTLAIPKLQPNSDSLPLSDPQVQKSMLPTMA